MPVVESWAVMMFLQRAANVIAVRPEVGVFATGEEDHQGHPGRARPVFTPAAGPVPVFPLCGREVLQAAVVHLAHVARNHFAKPRRRQLRLRRHRRDRDQGRRDQDNREIMSTFTGGSSGAEFRVRSRHTSRVSLAHVVLSLFFLAFRAGLIRPGRRSGHIVLGDVPVFLEHRLFPFRLGELNAQLGPLIFAEEGLERHFRQPG